MWQPMLKSADQDIRFPFFLACTHAMPFGSAEPSQTRTHQRTSARSRLYLYAALGLFLMVADGRFEFARPLRAALATALYPVQWLLLQPIRLVHDVRVSAQTLAQLQTSERQAREQLAEQSAQALQAQQLADENQQLRKLLGLQPRLAATGQVAEVLYLSTDAFQRKVIIAKGQLQGVAAGSPVLDERGVLGQVTRVYPLVAEVTLLVDRAQAIPVLNTRTRARSVAYGQPAAVGSEGDTLELRFMAGSSDVEPGDLLVTSGGDGVYPPGLPVATVDRIDRRADASFSHIQSTPAARIAGVRYVMVLQPVAGQMPPRPGSADDLSGPGNTSAERKKGRGR